MNRFYLGLIFAFLALAGLCWISSAWVGHLRSSGAIGQDVTVA